MLLRLAQNSSWQAAKGSQVAFTCRPSETHKEASLLRGVADAELWPIAARLPAASLTRFQGAIGSCFAAFTCLFSCLAACTVRGRAPCARYQYIIPGGVPNRHPWGTGECSLIGIHPVLIAVLHPSCSTLTFSLHLSSLILTLLLSSPILNLPSATYSVSVKAAVHHRLSTDDDPAILTQHLHHLTSQCLLLRSTARSPAMSIPPSSRYA